MLSLCQLLYLYSFLQFHLVATMKLLSVVGCDAYLVIQCHVFLHKISESFSSILNISANLALISCAKSDKLTV